MTFKEFEKFADAIKTYFPRENVFSSKESAGLWYEELKDLDYHMAAMELRKYVSLNRFAPTIADIRECLIDFTEKKELSAPESWEIVIIAVREVEESGAAKKKFEALPELAKKAVGGYAQFLELSENPNARHMAKPNFMRVYTKLLEKDLELKKLNPSIREMINRSVDADRIEQDGTVDKIGLEDEWVDL